MSELASDTLSETLPEKASLNISAVDTRRVEGEPNPDFELKFEGFRNNDDVSDLDELPGISCDANIASKPGIYPIVLSGGYDNNYDYILRNGQIVVEERNPIVFVQSILLSADSWEGQPGDRIQIGVQILPENSTNMILKWASNDETVATVDELGFVTAQSEGVCLITVASTDGSNVCAECQIKVSSESGVSDIFHDDVDYNVYNLQGVLIKESADKSFIQTLRPGVYILRKGVFVKKIFIK